MTSSAREARARRRWLRCRNAGAGRTGRAACGNLAAKVSISPEGGKKGARSIRIRRGREDPVV